MVPGQVPGALMISIFMPAYNVQKYLSNTVERIPNGLWNQISMLHIINDGSADETASAANLLAQQNAKIRHHQFPVNQGYGAVVRFGIAECLRDDSDVIVCLHGDGQYAPELLPQMLETMDGYRLDLLQGSRLGGRGNGHGNSHGNGALAGGMPLYKWLAGQCLCSLENRVFNLRLTDYHSGFLLYRRRYLLKSGFENLKGHFEIDLELIASAKARGFLVGEVAIPTRYAGEVSHLNPFDYGLRVLQVLWRYLRGKYAAKH